MQCRRASTQQSCFCCPVRVVRSEAGPRVGDTKIFYYRGFRDIHIKKTFLFYINLGHVVFMLPPVEPLSGSWLPLVHAVSMWLAIGCLLYLVPGPRTADDNAWYRVCSQARDHVDSYVHAHLHYRAQVIDKLPVIAGAADTSSPCFALPVTGWKFD